MQNDELKQTESSDGKATEYEAPEIELTLTKDDLEREVHYAGNGTRPPG